MTDERRRTRRRFLRASGLVGAAGLAGCSFEAGPVDVQVGGDGTERDGSVATDRSDDATGGDDGTPRGARGGTLRLASPWFGSLDPVEAFAADSVLAVNNLFDGLTTFENGGTEVGLQLAASVDVSSDHRTYTFALADATFHDGRPVTASDVVYSWERVGTAERSLHEHLLTDVLRADHRTTTDEDGDEVYRPGSLNANAVDEETVRLELLEPNHAALAVLAHRAFSVIPEGVVGDVEGYPGEMDQEEFATTGPVGAGAFRLDAWREDEAVVLSRFADYHGPPALLDGVRWELVDDAGEAYRYGQRGNADVVDVPDDEWDPSLVTVRRTDDAGRRFGTYGPMSNGETVDYLAVPLLSTFSIGFNTDRVPKPVRQAFAYATNQHAIASQVFRKRAATAYHLTPPATFPGGNYESHLEGYPYGVGESKRDEATRVMEEAGYSESNVFSITVLGFQTRAWKALLTNIGNQLSDAHVDVQIDPMSSAKRLEQGSQGNHEAYTFGSVPAATGPDEVFERLNPPNTETVGAGTEGMYLNWTGTDAAQQAASSYQTVAANQEPTDAARGAREQAYVAMEEANWEDVAVLPVHHGMDERLAYDWVDVPPFGARGSYTQMLNDASLGERG